MPTAPKRRFALSSKPVYLVERLLTEFEELLCAKSDDGKGSKKFDATATLFNHKTRSWIFTNLSQTPEGNFRYREIFGLEQQLPNDRNIREFIEHIKKFIKQNPSQKQLGKDLIKLEKDLIKLESELDESKPNTEAIDFLLLKIYSSLPNAFSELIPGAFFSTVNDSDFQSALHEKTKALLTKGFARLSFEFISRDGQNTKIIFRARQEFSAEIAKASDFFFKASSGVDKPGDKVYSPQVYLTLPIWDIWINGRGFGAVSGFIFVEPLGISADNENDANHEAAAALKQLWQEWHKSDHFVLDRLEFISAELYRSALARISDYRIGLRDFFDVYIEAISEVQSWDKIEILDVSKPTDNQIIRSVTFGNEHSSDSETTRTPLEWKTVYWNTEFVQELIGSELPWLNYSIRFYYPAFVLQPTTDPLKKAFENILIEQQMEVLRMLLPIYRAQRALRRIAISAIMGRNMSHNIGSHVLANVSAKFTDIINQEKPPHVVDPRAQFIAFLQERMDFAASISTGSEAFWSESLSLKEAISFFDRESSSNSTDVKNPLLEYIAGKSELLASAKYCTDTDIRIACPGGRIGAHALYIIIENIIRNSARHGTHSQREGEVTTVVEVQLTAELVPSAQLVKIEIIDPYFDPENADKIEEMASILNYGRSVPEGKKSEDYDLLGKDGSPNPKHWGLREMQICAHVLRGWSLDDLGRADSDYPVISAKHSEKQLIYTIYIPMEKTLAIVGTQGDGQLGLEQGVKWISPRAQPEHGISAIREYIAREARGYDFLVVDCDQTLNLKTRNQFPVRSFCMRDEAYKKVEDALRQKDAEQVKRFLFKELESQYLVKHGDHSVRKVFWTHNHQDLSSEAVAPYKLNGWEIEPIPHHLQYYTQMRFTVGRIDHANFEGREVVIEDLISGVLNEHLAWGSLESVFDGSSKQLDMMLSESSGIEYSAAALASVVVIDERIQSSGSNSGIRWRNAKHFEMWRAMNVWVPDSSEVNLNSANFGTKEDFEKLRSFINKNLERSRQAKLSPPDFLVVHLTLLEKFKATLSAKDIDLDPQDKIDLVKLLAALVPKPGERPRTILISGRGISRSNENNFRFLPFSSVSAALVGQCDKLRLMRTLWASSLPS
jgi:hypothetical protein